ncbi:MAG: ABC transporter permease [Candidatus Pseudobacter hemicellulosilyticus]|uniref:ABC transporter permease n=1 Tax=Candidatus Pseudobacter hemicellulosilyticus TaxID=3121375 RepID=A0AAJ6BGK8_9BACT|nr:MAG: ABC transporter permease [Pseudobacter sp.]
MFRNFLKTAFRNLWKHRTFSLINILGLTVGLTGCFLIFLYVRFEMSYESWHPKKDRIFRVVANIKTPTEELRTTGPSWAVPSNLKDEFPEVEDFVRFSRHSILFRYNDIKIQEENTRFVDSSLFRVFGFRMLKGNPATALRDPRSVVLTETAAKKYFGNEDPIGKVLLMTNEGQSASVTGVIRDVPENTDLKGDVYVSMTTLTKEWNPSLDKQWGNYGSMAYLLLRPGTDPKALEKKFPGFLQKRNGKEMEEHQMFASLFLEPLREVYLYTTREGNKTGRISNVYVFSIVAAFILLIACINFINLTTARSTERAREVGIRKVVGALKGQLTRQFLTESLLISSVAFILSMLSAALLLPAFNELAGKQISSGIFSNPEDLAVLLAASIGVGLLAGLYPALVLSSFRPIVVLKGRFATGAQGILLRKGLVIFQFTISIALVIGTLVVNNQMRYMNHQNLGFNKDQMLVLTTFSDPQTHTFKEELRKLAGVRQISAGSSVPGDGYNSAYSEIENRNGDLQVANLRLYFVDFDYIPLFDMKLVAGRAFSGDFKTDTTQAMLLNESAVKMFGYTSPEQAIGKRFKQWGREGKIIGVLKDFHYTSLQSDIAPLTLRIEPGAYDKVIANIPAAAAPATIATIEKKWKEFFPNRPFSYSFLNDIFDQQYRSEQRFGKLFLNFAILAIFISCLGLLGLASYSTMQRTKEIGIRKVMGASVSNILHLLSSDFLKLVSIAFVIAAPLAGFFMYRWLQDFAYRSQLSWWIFGLAAILALLITVTTISFLAIRAALANPVKSLRAE